MLINDAINIKANIRAKVMPHGFESLITTRIEAINPNMLTSIYPLDKGAALNLIFTPLLFYIKIINKLLTIEVYKINENKRIKRKKK